MIVLYLVFMFGTYNQAVTADAEVSNQFSKLGIIFYGKLMPKSNKFY